MSDNKNMVYILYATFPKDNHFGDINTQDEFTSPAELKEVAALYKWFTDNKVKLRVDKVDMG